MYNYGVCSSNGIYIESTLDATNNWWRSSTGPYHPTLNTAGTGN